MIAELTRILGFIMIIGFLASCKQTVAPSGLMELEFDIDSSLLAENPVIDSALGIAFYPPKNWVEAEIASLQLSDEALPKKHLVPKHFYIHPADSSSMLIAFLQNLSNEQLAIMRINFSEIFNSQGIWDDVQHAAFTFNDFEIDQFMMRNKALVNFKLFLSPENARTPDHRISIDYLLPLSHYEENVKSVESSIGSLLLLLNQNN